MAKLKEGEKYNHLVYGFVAGLMVGIGIGILTTLVGLVG